IKARMRPDGDAVAARDLRGADHDVGVARMKAAGDVGGGDDAKHRLVIAHSPRAESLAHVAVEIDFHDPTLGTFLVVIPELVPQLSGSKEITMMHPPVFHLPLMGHCLQRVRNPYPDQSQNSSHRSLKQLHPGQSRPLQSTIQTLSKSLNIKTHSSPSP